MYDSVNAVASVKDVWMMEHIDLGLENGIVKDKILCQKMKCICHVDCVKGG